MKKLYCSQYEFECCATCHERDEFYKLNYKGFEIWHCCTTHYPIQKDIDKHSEEVTNEV